MKNLLLFLIFALLCYFAYEKYARPQTQQLTGVKLTPTPTPTPTLTPTPTPTPTPAPTPEPTPTEQQAALQRLLDEPTTQPDSVTLLVEREFPLSMNGRTVGKTKVAAGTAGKLIAWEADQVTVEMAGAPRKIPWIDTDFMAQVLESFRSSKDGSKNSAEPPNNPQTVEQNSAPTPAATFDLGREIAATALAEYCDANRSTFAELEGSPVQVAGVVQDIDLVAGNLGAGTVAQVSLKTRPDLPKVRLLIRPSDFLSNEGDYDRVELRINNKALELRTRDSRDRTNYYYWYYYNGYWQRRLTPKTEWVRVLYVGAPVNAAGVLSKFHINIDLEGAKIKKDGAEARLN